jgi:23S rRNA (cytidine1920-2'-O)/16S rRNA (cytidine1409-2'-O)-methyltransferase
MASATKLKKRLDVLVYERGLAESRQRAQAMILAGQIFVNQQKAAKAGAQVSVDVQIEAIGTKLKYASRGGLKLEGAFEDFGISVAGKICLDAGASTGGFTDCLLQHDAARVYAVDVNVDQLDWRLRQDARVVRVKQNARSLCMDDIGERVGLITVDVSFISVTKVLPALMDLAAEGCEFVILVKPQFELEKRLVGKGGIVQDPKLHEIAVEKVRNVAEGSGLEILGVLPSRVTGAEGNQEYFIRAIRTQASKSVSPIPKGE